MREGADGVKRGDEPEEEMETAPHEATIEIVNCFFFFFLPTGVAFGLHGQAETEYLQEARLQLHPPSHFFLIFLSFSTLFPLICPLYFFKIAFICAPFPPSLLYLFDYECVRWVGE